MAGKPDPHSRSTAEPPGGTGRDRRAAGPGPGRPGVCRGVRGPRAGSEAGRRMRVRRVRLLPPHLEAGTVSLALRAPRARRVPGKLDRLRVCSIWLQDEQADLATHWGWKPEP